MPATTTRIAIVPTACGIETEGNSQVDNSSPVKIIAIVPTACGIETTARVPL